MTTTIDLNCDLGEGGGFDRALLELASSANIACGFHAGDPLTAASTAAAAARLGVTVGAHPSYDDREGFGRRPLDPHPDRLAADIAYQVGALQAVASLAGTTVRYVKAHGSLYNRAAVDDGQAGILADVAARLGLPLLVPPGSRAAQVATERGVAVFAEAFADRAYLPDGTLAPRSTPGAVITDSAAVVRQALSLALEGSAPTPQGPVAVRATSICLHGDTPGAVELAAAVRGALEAEGVTIAPFA